MIPSIQKLSSGFYTVGDTKSEGKRGLKRAVRPVLFEDRILGVEQKFFCDRTTEKTITLTVGYYHAISYFFQFPLLGEG